MTRPALPSPPRTNRRTLLIGLATILTVSAGTAPGTANATARPQSPSNPLVRYEVSGAPGTAEYLTYEIDYQQGHETNVSLPWSKQFSTSRGHTFLLSAQGHGPGSLTCRILIDGRVVSQATASGEPARTVCAPSQI
ncbi:MAG: MmpS family transport accessory protein [Mycobacterium sp.]|uniref:MmpS family transport accessory protein n=1 Tax=Mycobacterium sp. TaxID=1785 RepID=UPI003CC65001